MSRIDLHIHTSASDGTLSPGELIHEVKDNNIEIFAIADHDSIDSLAQVSSLSLKNSLKFIPAAEISAFYKGKVFHILSYGCDFNSEYIKELLEYNQDIWASIDIKRVEWVSKNDWRTNLKEFEKYTYDNTRGGWRSLNYMIDKGIIENMQQYFNMYSDFVMDKTFSPLEEVLSAVKDAGGAPFLAHPAYSKDKNAQFMSINLLNDLFKCGIVGIECYNIYNESKLEEQYYLAYAKEKNLFISGGSDYHGKFISERKIGVPYITTDMLGSNWFNEYIISN
jgi:predicted metal-dependent phosphoesterase TrpH